MMWGSLRAVVVGAFIVMVLGGAHASPGVVSGGPSLPAEVSDVDPGQPMACPTDDGTGNASNGTAPNGTASNATSDLQGTAGSLCEPMAQDPGGALADSTGISALLDQTDSMLVQFQHATPISLTNPGPPRPLYEGTVDPPIVGSDRNEDKVDEHSAPEDRAERAPTTAVDKEPRPAATPDRRPDPTQRASPDEEAPPPDARPLSLSRDPAEVRTGDLRSLALLVPFLALSMVLFWQGASRLARFIQFPLAAFYARIHGSQLEENPHRRLILEFLQENAGASLQRVSTGTRISYSTAKYHLKVLEYHGQLVSRRSGKSRCFFIRGAQDAGEARLILDNHPLSRRLAAFVATRPGVIQKDICQAFGIWPSHAHTVLGRLEDLGIIRTQREGRAVHYFPAARCHDEPNAPLFDAA